MGRGQANGAEDAQQWNFPFRFLGLEHSGCIILNIPTITITIRIIIIASSSSSSSSSLSSSSSSHHHRMVALMFLLILLSLSLLDLTAGYMNTACLVTAPHTLPPSPPTVLPVLSTACVYKQPAVSKAESTARFKAGGKQGLGFEVEENSCSRRKY